MSRAHALERRCGRPLFLLTLLGTCVLPPLLLWLVWCSVALPVPGTRIAHWALPTSGSLRDFLDAKARSWADESLTLELGYHVFRPTRAELGAALPVAEALDAVRGLGRSANPIITLRALWVGEFGHGHDLHWRPRITRPAALTAYVEKLRAQIDRLPLQGSYAPDGASIAGLAGEVLDGTATQRAIERAIASGDKTLTLGTLVTAPLPSFRRFAQPVDAARVPMMSSETSYRAGGGRAVNIELAAQKLDGTVILPGAAFSFNAVVGKRERTRGFAAALELVGGEVVDGVGGGVCQVAGTLHAAAFFAGLTVDEYRPHSRLNQFAYLRPGLDTMVAWPEHVTQLSQTRDMRLTNPYPFPIVVRVSIVKTPAKPSELHVTLFGAAKPFRVDWSFDELARVPAGELTRPDPSLPKGERRVLQEPLAGLEILRRRTIYMPTRRIDEQTHITYPPTPRIVRVGTGAATGPT